VTRESRCAAPSGLYKILFSSEAVVQELTIFASPPAHLHCPPWCNTIARLFGTVNDFPLELSFVIYAPYNIGTNKFA